MEAFIPPGFCWTKYEKPWDTSSFEGRTWHCPWLEFSAPLGRRMVGLCETWIRWSRSKPRIPAIRIQKLKSTSRGKFLRNPSRPHIQICHRLALPPGREIVCLGKMPLPLFGHNQEDIPTPSSAVGAGGNCSSHWVVLLEQQEQRGIKCQFGDCGVSTGTVLFF